MEPANGDIKDEPIDRADEFRYVFDHSAVPQSLTRPSGEVEVNDALLQLLGYSRAELRERSTWQSLTHPDDIALTEGFMQSLIRGEQESVRFEKRYLTKDGATVWAEVSSTLRRDAATGEPDYFITTIVDITERIRALRALELSEAKFETAFRTSLDAVLITRLSDGRLLDANEGFTRLLGYTAEDVVGKTSTEIALWLEPDSRAGLVSELGANGEIHNAEVLLRRKDGTTAAGLLSAQLIEIAGEQCILSVTRDVSQGRQAAEQHRAILRATMDGFWLSDPEGHIVEVNEAYCAMSGYSEQELLGMRVSDLEVLESVEEVAAHARRIAEVGESRFESRHRRKDGSVFEVESSVNFLPEAGLFASFQRDVTDRKTAEEKLRTSEAAVRKRLRVILEPEQGMGPLRLADILDRVELQSMMDEFFRLTHIGIGVIDLHGNVLVGTGWQDVCTRFHRVNQGSLANCLESDQQLAEGVPTGEFRSHHCSNHMWDIVTPIEIGGSHLGNVFLGQFFYEDEVIDYEVFREQARRFGFDEAEYMAALERVPRWSHETVDAAMSFYAKLAAMISSFGYGNVKLSRALAQKDALLAERGQHVDRLGRALASIVEIVGQAVESRDPYTAGHQRRVSELSVRIAEQMRMPALQVEGIRIAALLHDIGKMSVPAEILSKPGRLSEIEFALIKSHSEAGWRMITSAHMEGSTAEIVHQHHERCDGSGYPRGISAEALLPESKVIMVADVVEAMVSHRPYRPGLGTVAALTEIEQGAGSAYDEDVVSACLRVFREQGFEFVER